MADIYAIFGSLIFLGITYPALLTAWRLLFPGAVQRSRERIVGTPWKCFGLGTAGLAGAVIPGLILFNLPSQAAQLLAWIWLVFLLSLSSMAAAGLAAELGSRLQQSSSEPTSGAGATLRGAFLLELSSAFPVIGWLLILPVGLLVTLGAGVFALFRWTPQSAEALEAA